MLRVLDTDMLTILWRGEGADYDRLRARIEAQPQDDFVTTIVSYQEQMQGWLAKLNKAGKPAQVLQVYGKLQTLISNFAQFKVLPFDQPALSQFDAIKNQARGVGTMDLRIAGIVLANEGMLLSRNLRDFRKVPGLIVEDWSE